MSRPDGAESRQRIGARIAGKYTLIREVGSGGMGAVYEAEHAFTGKRVALKILHAEHTHRKGFAERFLREANAASKIGHTGIVDVFDAGRDEDGTLYLALELLRGEDLAHLLERGPVDVIALARTARDLLDALAAAHARGIVHRDLKPENIFLSRIADGTDVVKLLDFGIAKQMGEDEKLRLTTTGTVLGTPYFMSPEQARGKGIDGRSDLWALGAVLFDAIVGQPPFVGENYNAVLAAILTEPVPSVSERRPDVPAELATIVDLALARDVAARWQSAEAMRDALTKFLARPVPTVVVGTAPRTLGGSTESGVRDTSLADATPRFKREGARPSLIGRAPAWARATAGVLGVMLVLAFGFLAYAVWKGHAASSHTTVTQLPVAYSPPPPPVVIPPAQDHVVAPPQVVDPPVTPPPAGGTGGTPPQIGGTGGTHRPPHHVHTQPNPPPAGHTGTHTQPNLPPNGHTGTHTWHEYN